MNDKHTNEESNEEVQRATSFRRSKNSSSPNGQLLYNPSRRNAGLGLVVPQNILDDEDDETEKESSLDEEKSEKETPEEEGTPNQNQTGENVSNPGEGQKERTTVKGKAAMDAFTFIKNFKRNAIIIAIVGAIVLIMLLFFIFASSSGSVASLDDCYGGDDSGWWWPIGGATENGDGFYDGEPVYKDTNPSDYGPRDPSIGTSDWHDGVDITVNGIGDPVIASKSGTVEIAEFDSARHNHSCSNGVNKLCDKNVYDCYGYGNYVLINHKDGTQSLYGHLSEVTVSTGEQVEQGQLIGKTGSTGMSTGPHLHFEIRINGSTVDPLDYISIDNPRPGKKICLNNGDCTGTNGDLKSFLYSWEGNEGPCTIDGQDGYLAADTNDAAITLGPGFTQYAMLSNVVDFIKSNGYSKYFPYDTITPGMCVPVSVFEKVFLYALETNYAKEVENAAAKYNVTLTQFQKDALTDFNYNQGTGYIDEVMSAYASGGYEELWNAMARHTKGGMEVIKKRLKGEFALFVTGDYSDQGKFYSRNTNNFYDYNSEDVMSRKMVCNGNISTKNYTKSTSNGLNDVLTKELKDALLEHNTTYKQFNESILSSVINAGVGTRDGVVAAAVSLVAGLYENYQIRIPYTYGGQHGYALSTAASPLGSSFYGADPTWGKNIGNFYLGGYGPYHYYGPDCSGFVMWALHNGGMKAYPGLSTEYASLGKNITLNGTRVGDPGDLMAHPGHIMLIVGVDDAKKVYYIAHAAGGQQGVKINTVNFSDSYNQVVKMDNFYANADNREYTNSTDFANAFRAGEL